MQVYNFGSGSGLLCMVSAAGLVGTFYPVEQSKKEGGQYRLVSTIVYKTCQHSLSTLCFRPWYFCCMATEWPGRLHFRRSLHLQPKRNRKATLVRVRRHLKGSRQLSLPDFKTIDTRSYVQDRTETVLNTYLVKMDRLVIQIFRNVAPRRLVKISEGYFVILTSLVG
jgi:hypothetical protein